MDDLRTRFGERVRILRRRAGLSLEELAGRARLAPSTLARVERGKASARVAAIEQIATALGKAPAALFAFPSGMELKADPEDLAGGGHRLSDELSPEQLGAVVAIMQMLRAPCPRIAYTERSPESGHDRECRTAV